MRLRLVTLGFLVVGAFLLSDSLERPSWADSWPAIRRVAVDVEKT